MLLTFAFKTVEEAQAFLLKNFTNQTADNAALAVQPISFPPGALEQAAKDTETATAPAPKKRGPKPKAEPTKEYTIDDCRDALSALFDKKGRDAAKRVLTEFKVARIGELTAPDYGMFILTCAAASK